MLSRKGMFAVEGFSKKRETHLLFFSNLEEKIFLVFPLYPKLLMTEGKEIEQMKNSIFNLRFCRIWNEWYLITSQTRVKYVRWTHHPTLLKQHGRWCTFTRAASIVHWVHVFDRRSEPWCIRLTRMILVCEETLEVSCRLLRVRKIWKKTFGLAARNRLSLYLPLSFSY